MPATLRAKENLRKGRAQAVVMMYAKGVITEEQLVQTSHAAKISKKDILIAADWLTKNMELKYNPFPWTEYRKNNVLISARARRDMPGLRWCSRCGRYQSIAAFYKFDDPTGKKPYSHLCREHHLEKQRESDHFRADKIKANKRRRYHENKKKKQNA